MSLMGRRTCVSASALSLDAQPAHVERVVRRISRPVLGMGICLQIKWKVESENYFLLSIILMFAFFTMVLLRAGW